MTRSGLRLFVSFLLAIFIMPLVNVAKASPKAAINSAPQQKKKYVSKRAKATPAKRRTASRSATRYPRAVAASSIGNQIGLGRTHDELDLESNAALVLDQESFEVLFAKNEQAVLPIASLTKLMTALVVIEAGQDMDEILTVTEEDVDRIKGTSSRLRLGAQLTRGEMLHIALMSSENRAASALGRHYPGGLTAFVKAMNAKAAELGMTDTRFVEPTGLSSKNVSSARDLANLVLAAYEYPMLREYSTGNEAAVDPGGRILQYRNSNYLVGNPEWQIGLQKTGYIVEAGRCLVMQAMIEGRSVIMVFLDARSKLARIGDAGRIRKWLESRKFPLLSGGSSGSSGDYAGSIE